MTTQDERDAQDARSLEGFAERVQATFNTELALLEESRAKLFNHNLELTAEVQRLTEALADRDRMAQQLALAQSEARGLREELRRLSAPNGGVM